MSTQPTHRRFLAKLVLMVILVFSLTPVMAQEWMATVHQDGGVVMRSGPGKNYVARASVDNLSTVEVVGRNADGSWVEVRTPNRRRTAWVPAMSLSLPADVMSLTQTSGLVANSAFVKTPVLNIRTGPGANFDVIGQLRYGRGLNIIGRNLEGSWAQVEVPGESTGWASIRYLSINFDFSTAPVVDDTGVFAGYVDPIPVDNTKVGFISAYPSAIIRHGPADEAPYLFELGTGEGVYLRAKNHGGDWLLVQMDNGDIGWIRKDYLSTDYDTNSLPIQEQK